MDHVTPRQSMDEWLTPEQLSEGQDRYTVRFEQSPDAGPFRTLTQDEIATLKKLGNQAENWSQILVTEPFDPACLQQNHFYGLVRLGSLTQGVLEHEDMTVPKGISHTCVVDCDLESDVAVHHVGYLSHCIVRERTILFACGEIRTTPEAAFGISQIKTGQTPDAFDRIHVMNENGGRGIGLFPGILPADAMLWARYRDRTDLMSALETMTASMGDIRYGAYSDIQSQCVIKHTRQIIDVKLGPCTDVINADRLQNLTISSTEQEPVLIQDGVTLCTGIVGAGCTIKQGVRAEQFVIGDHVTLENTARLKHTVVGDNSTIACCEVLNSLIFPVHQQHHNNSFLIASCLMGQTNLAAGSTIGSNHNGRVNDNEVCAGRGFWPGLCTSVKHPSRFASYVLLAKGDFPYELNITLPFSLVINDPAKDHLKVMPAYWWMYNVYALARNADKFRQRDRRKAPRQMIEFQALAPDTVHEIQQAMAALEVWIAQSHLRALGRVETNIESLRSKGRHLLDQATVSAPDIDVTTRGLENSKRCTIILKAFEGYHAYADMLLHYGVTQLMTYLQTTPDATLKTMNQALNSDVCHDWINLGGQLVPACEVERLCTDIAQGTLQHWSDVHARYDELWKGYPLAKMRHAYAVLCDTLKTFELDLSHWQDVLDRALLIQQSLCDRVQSVREKDFLSPYMQSLFQSKEEMDAVMGTIQTNAFVRDVREQTHAFARQVQRFKSIQ